MVYVYSHGLCVIKCYKPLTNRDVSKYLKVASLSRKHWRICQGILNPGLMTNPSIIRDMPLLIILHFRLVVTR